MVDALIARLRAILESYEYYVIEDLIERLVNDVKEVEPHVEVVCEENLFDDTDFIMITNASKALLEFTIELQRDKETHSCRMDSWDISGIAGCCWLYGLNWGY